MFFFKQKASYEMCISDWSSDVFSADLACSRVMRANRFPEHLFLVGCGNMAGPMLARWLECGLDPARVTVYRPSGKSVADGVAVLDAWPEYLPDGTLVLLGLKPYPIDDVAPRVAGMKGQDFRLGLLFA